MRPGWRQSAVIFGKQASHRELNNFWYRFIVSDGTDADFYADNTAALDGGLGKASEDALDQSYALMFSSPNFEAPALAEECRHLPDFP